MIKNNPSLEILNLSYIKTGIFNEKKLKIKIDSKPHTTNLKAISFHNCGFDSYLIFLLEYIKKKYGKQIKKLKFNNCYCDDEQYYEPLIKEIINFSNLESLSLNNLDYFPVLKIINKIPKNNKLKKFEIIGNNDEKIYEEDIALTIKNKFPNIFKLGISDSIELKRKFIQYSNGPSYFHIKESYKILRLSSFFDMKYLIKINAFLNKVNFEELHKEFKYQKLPMIDYGNVKFGIRDKKPVEAIEIPMRILYKDIIFTNNKYEKYYIYRFPYPYFNFEKTDKKYIVYNFEKNHLSLVSGNVISCRNGDLNSDNFPDNYLSEADELDNCRYEGSDCWDEEDIDDEDEKWRDFHYPWWDEYKNWKKKNN